MGLGKWQGIKKQKRRKLLNSLASRKRWEIEPRRPYGKSTIILNSESWVLPGTSQKNCAKGVVLGPLQLMTARLAIEENAYFWVKLWRQNSFNLLSEHSATSSSVVCLTKAKRAIVFWCNQVSQLPKIIKLAKRSNKWQWRFAGRRIRITRFFDGRWAEEISMWDLWRQTSQVKEILNGKS